MKKIWILLSIFSVVAILFVVTIKYVNAGKIDMTSEDADFSITSNEIISEFENDENSANNKYLNKVVLISGTIGEIIANQDNEPILILKENGKSAGINCRISDEKNIKSHYLVGNPIKIKGIVQGYLDDVIVTNCIIVNYISK